MSLILSRNRGGAVTIAPPAGNRRSVQPIRSVIRVVQAPSNNGAQVSSPRQRRRRVRPRGRMAVSVPATSGQARINVQPRFSGSNGRMTVAHSEVLEEVFGSTGFSGVRYAVTPIALPYLKGVAQNFSRYRWLSCRVSFITSSPTSQSGTVGMGATYDGLDLLPNTMSELGSLAHNSIGPVWGPPGTRANTLVFDSSRWSKAWYPYYDGNVSLEDIVSYIPAFLILGKQTQVNGQPIGRLEFEYVIEFLDPIPARLNAPVVAVEGSSATEADSGKISVGGVTKFGVDDTKIEPSADSIMLSALMRFVSLSELTTPPPDAAES